MKNNLATYAKSLFFSGLQLLFLCLLALLILRHPAKACSYSALALQLWFEKMIPSLFPFMVLSGMIVRLDFGKTISSPVYPLIGRLYRISKTMCTTLLLGFLFGFPLGAKTIAEQYDLGQLSKPQAQYLLSFCNNIGPVYLLSFALPLLGLSCDTKQRFLRLAVILSFFGIPLLYGLVLRYTFYRNANFSKENAPSLSGEISFISALDSSITSACVAITRLGGYMIFFIVCNLLLEQTPFTAFASPILEITSGLSLARNVLSPTLFMTMLTFGGLSCFAQTYTCIRDTDLSFRNYCLHKLLQSTIAFCVDSLIFSVFCGMPPAV